MQFKEYHRQGSETATMTTAEAASADRNLVFGLLAVQMNLLDRGRLVGLLEAWLAHWPCSFGQYLVEHGVLSAADRDRLDDALARNGWATPADAEDAPPLVQARFRKLREHARGGLGVVSVAVDETLQREVALKEIRDPLPGQTMGKVRFLREARITGRLEHPGIVPVYGLGVYPDGRPFYAMRLIGGETLQAALDRFHAADRLPGRDPAERARALRGLLGRFSAICQTMAYAHSRGVIHRDLKPTNVMLGEYGETLIVDWGLARMLDDDDESPGDRGPSSDDGLQTEQGLVIGTRAYMSPEQASGRHDLVGVASDVFALGATLSNVLVGRPPFDPAGPPRAADPRVPPALAAVCQRAMASDPARRYPSAKALADEIDRYLADEPVQAYREPVGRRLSRWARRHRTTVSVGVALLMAAVVGLGIGLWAVHAEQVETATERDRAEEQLARAEANLALAQKAVDECFHVAKDQPLLQDGRLKAVKKLLLEKALPFYEQFSAQAAATCDEELAQADTFLRVGYITAEIGREADALAAYRQAREIHERWLEASPDDAGHLLGLAETLNRLGSLHSKQGDLARGEETLALAERCSERLVGIDPASAKYRVALTAPRMNLAIILARRGQKDEALRLFRRLREGQQAWLAEQPASADARVYLTQALNNEVVTLQTLGRTAEALPLARQALDHNQRLCKDQPTNGFHQRDHVRTAKTLGSLLRKMNLRPEAVAVLEPARQLGERLLTQTPDSIEVATDLAGVYLSLSSTTSEMDKNAEALGQFSRCGELLERAVAAQPENADHRHDLARCLGGLGNVQRALGKPDDAAKTYRRAIDLSAALTKLRPDVVDYHHQLYVTSFNRGLLLSQRAAHGEALPDLDRAMTALAALERLTPRGPQLREFRVSTHVRRAFALGGVGRHADAVADWDRALDLCDPKARLSVQARRAECLARTDAYPTARREADTLFARQDLSAPVQVIVAQVYALCGDAVAREATVPLAVREWQSRRDDDRALAVLKRAGADAKALAHPDFARLRSRLVKP